LPGQAPTVRAFEADNTVTYHEVGGFEPGRQPGEKKATDKKPEKKR
jgi:4-hydroxy-3-polyprenylbenzoate decarboxylase